MFQRTIHVKCKDVLVEGTLKLKIGAPTKSSEDI